MYLFLSLYTLYALILLFIYDLVLLRVYIYWVLYSLYFCSKKFQQIIVELRDSYQRIEQSSSLCEFIYFYSRNITYLIELAEYNEATIVSKVEIVLFMPK